MDANEKRTFAIALAGGAISSALLDVLHEKGILSLDEARDVLGRALKQVGGVSQNEGAYEAMGIITTMMAGRFSARR